MESQKSSKKVIIGACAAAVVVAAVGIGAYMMNRGGEEESEGYTITEENYQQITDEMDTAVEEGYFETYMNTEWTFADGTAETEDAIFGNSPNNTKPIRMELIMDDTGEVVYKTGVLPVGAELPPFKLDVDLDAGKYDMTCQVYLMNETEGGTYVDASSAGFHVTVTVEN